MQLQHCCLTSKPDFPICLLPPCRDDRQAWLSALQKSKVVVSSHCFLCTSLVGVTPLSPTGWTRLPNAPFAHMSSRQPLQSFLVHFNLWCMLQMPHQLCSLMQRIHKSAEERIVYKLQSAFQDAAIGSGGAMQVNATAMSQSGRYCSSGPGLTHEY